MALVPAVAVRTLHLLAVAVTLGGAGLTWLQFRRVAGTASADPTTAHASALALAERYEWLFWLAVGLVALTGVGNLGAMAPAIPTEGEWATTLVAKLGLLLAFLVASVWRTLVVVRIRSATGEMSASLSSRSLGVLHWSYAGTTVVLVVLLALAEVLAHG